jgi:hypothetical protein
VGLFSFIGAGGNVEQSDDMDYRTPQRKARRATES